MPNEPQVIDVAMRCLMMTVIQYLGNSISQRLQNESLTIPHYG